MNHLINKIFYNIYLNSLVTSTTYQHYETGNYCRILNNKHLSSNNIHFLNSLLYIQQGCCCKVDKQFVTTVDSGHPCHVPYLFCSTLGTLAAGPLSSEQCALRTRKRSSKFEPSQPGGLYITKCRVADGCVWTLYVSFEQINYGTNRNAIFHIGTRLEVDHILNSRKSPSVGVVFFF